MIGDPAWRPSHDDPLFIMAMDHRESFGRTLFAVQDDAPDQEQLTAMQAAKLLIFDGLRQAAGQLRSGRAGVLVDERYGQNVIDQVQADGSAVLAVPVEASGHDWFTFEWGEDWLAHVERVKPAYAKVLVRDNPDFDASQRDGQFGQLARVTAGLATIGTPLLYELLVPATPGQLDQVSQDAGAYDRAIRPQLVAQVIADNQAHGIEPALWKVEGLETVEAARQIAAQARAGDRHADLIVLGRDAPAERLGHWLKVAREVPEFVGFAIGRSIWEDVLRDCAAAGSGPAAADRARHSITQRYLAFVADWGR